MLCTPAYRAILHAVLVGTFLSVTGCAYVAKRPDSPARHVSFHELNQAERSGERYYPITRLKAKLDSAD